MTEEVQISIYNLMGQLVLERTMTSEAGPLDVTKLNPGLYFVKAKGLQQKFIKA